MNAGLHRLVEQIQIAYASGRELILLFDYDGTLVPIVEHPRQAVLSDQTRRILECLARLPGIHLGIFSGRQLADLKRMVGIGEIYFAGTSGLELDFAGIHVRHPTAAAVLPILKRLDHLVAAIVRDFKGAWLERKPLGLTVHFRGVPQPNCGLLRHRVARIVTAFADRFRCRECALSLEITPNLGWDKGTAVRMIVESIGVTDVATLYAGDSANDSEAMDAVAASGGMTIAVGAEAPAAAAVRLQKPEDLFEFIDLLTERLTTIQLTTKALATCES